MKYKVGDKFLVEITEINDSCYPYTLSDIGAITTEENLDKLRRPDDMTVEEAWEIAGKIARPACYGGYTCEELGGIFGTTGICDIFEKNTPQQTKAKIEAWEAEKEIKVGDVVRAEDSTKAVVMDARDKCIEVLTENGCAEEWYKSKVTKTGRHIDIQGVLEQIGGAE